jgi:tetratricopeptide (TPR) repeat protein
MTKLLLILVLAQDIETKNEQARALAAQGNPAAAAELWRQIHKQSPTFFPAAFNLGYFHFTRKEFAEAKPYLDAATKSQPNDFNARFLLGQTHAALDQSDDAIRQWRAALALQPNHAKLLGILTIEYEKGDYYEEAAKTAKRLLALNPNDPTTHLLAIKAAQKSQDPAGPELAKSATKQFPNHPQLQFEQAWYEQRNGQTADAAQHLQRAIELDPNYDEPHYFLGGILLDQGKLTEAIPHLEKAIAIRPNYTAASVALGRALMEQENFEEAIKVLEAAANQTPNHPQPHLMLSRLYYRQGNLEKSQAAKQQSLKLRRNNPTLIETRQSRPFKP